MKTKSLKLVGSADSLLYVTFPNLNDKKCITAFTTRMGGVSRGKYASMNMSFSNGDSSKSVRKNYDILFSALGLDPERAVLSQQTHTDNIRIVGERDIGKGIVIHRDYKNVDGLITNLKGVPLVTQFADCVPLLFYDPENEVIAASHAGWRGTVQEIGRKTVEKMAEAFGSDPKKIKVAIGPSIGQCCYEVDAPVFENFSLLSYIKPESIFECKANGKYMLDLWTANRLILEHAGIKPKNICVTDLCTCCNSQFFHSHRASGGNRGNLAAVIALK